MQMTWSTIPIGWQADYREIRTEVTADAADKSARRGTRRK